MNSYVFIEHRGGQTSMTRTCIVNGKKVSQMTNRAPKNDLIPAGHLSTTNGIVGGEHVMRAHQKFDAEHGIDGVRYESIGHGAYKTWYPRKGKVYEKWNRARRRVNHHAACGMPAPGDFGYQ